MFALILVSSVTVTALWLARKAGRFAVRPTSPAASQSVLSLRS